MSPVPDEERREHSRESIELVVRYQRMNTFFADYAKNISRGGTFVATTEPLPKDTEFVFALGVPTWDEPLQLRARVMWTTEPASASEEKPAGMGIKFQFRDDDERAQMDRRIEKLIVAQLGERHARKILR